MNLSDKIDHIVVVMMENRSFDNLLGLLDHPEPAFRRPPADYTNPFGPDSNESPKKLEPTDNDVKGSGPSHHHANVLRQLTGPWSDAEWDAFGDRPWTALGPQWEQLVESGRSNRGFYWDYQSIGARVPKLVMRMWKEESVPALWQLAKEYAVCQRWHCSLPGMTQPNRLFAVCGTSFGHVDNPGAPRFFRRAPAGTSIFHRLDQVGITNAFFGDLTALSPFIYADLRGKRRRRKEFYERAAAGTLPRFSFVEPNNFPVPQSQHPGATAEGPETLWRGDAFIARVYNALRYNWESWQRTLLIITWDEHGGFPDHEPPPRNAAWSVDENVQDNGFDFSLLGPRVPAIIASPLIKPGTLDDEVRDHTCILSTARDAFPSFGEPMGPRAAVMPSVGDLLENAPIGGPERLKLAPERVDAPRFFKAYEEERDHHLDAYQRDVLEAMRGFAAEEGIETGSDKPIEALTVEEAIDIAKRIGSALGDDDLEIDPS